MVGLDSLFTLLLHLLLWAPLILQYHNIFSECNILANLRHFWAYNTLICSKCMIVECLHKHKISWLKLENIISILYQNINICFKYCCFIFEYQCSIGSQPMHKILWVMIFITCNNFQPTLLGVSSVVVPDYAC